MLRTRQIAVPHCHLSQSRCPAAQASKCGRDVEGFGGYGNQGIVLQVLVPRQQAVLMVSRPGLEVQVCLLLQGFGVQGRDRLSRLPTTGKPKKYRKGAPFRVSSRPRFDSIIVKLDIS